MKSVFVILATLNDYIIHIGSPFLYVVISIYILDMRDGKKNKKKGDHYDPLEI